MQIVMAKCAVVIDTNFTLLGYMANIVISSTDNWLCFIIQLQD